MKKIIITVLAGSALLVPSLTAWAGGFGISPPYVRNDSLTRNSHYEQTIILVRSVPDEDLRATITLNIPGADSWFTIDKGTEFIMPKGAQQMPMTVSVNVPDDAQFKHYTGNIRVVVSPLEGPARGTVGITIGAQIDVNIDVLDRKIIAFDLRSVKISDTEEGHQLWWMHFPGKIRFSMQVTNKGNVAAAPKKVVMEFRDALSGELLGTEENSNRLPKIKPFESRELVAEIPSYLKRGSYKASYTIYKDASSPPPGSPLPTSGVDPTILGTGTLDLSVMPRGTLLAYAGYGFWGIRMKEKLITFGIILGILLVLAFIVKKTFWLKKKLQIRKALKSGSLSAPPPRPPRA
ncbi:MAG: hypothetical protein Q7S28_00150 [bacterium]|nr:hypothetical protein [bacterium]